MADHKNLKLVGKPRPILKQNTKPTLYASSSKSEKSSEISDIRLLNLKILTKEELYKQQERSDGTKSNHIISFKSVSKNNNNNNKDNNKNKYMNNKNNERKLTPHRVMYNCEINKEIVQLIAELTNEFYNATELELNVNSDKNNGNNAINSTLESNNNNRQLITSCKEKFIPKLRDFLLGNWKNQNDMVERKKHYFSLSDPDLSKSYSMMDLSSTQEVKHFKYNLKNVNSSIKNYKDSKLNKKETQNIKQQPSIIDDIICGSLPSDSYLLSHGIEMLKNNNKMDIKQNKEEPQSFCSIIAAKKENKKFVRFADSLGLDLVSVQLIKDNNITSSNNNFSWQTDNAQNQTLSKLSNKSQKQYLVIIPCFTLAKHMYHDNIQPNNCKLIDYVFDNEGKILKFLIRVKNMSFEKHVFVRFTLNNWKSYTDVNSFFTYLTSLKQLSKSSSSSISSSTSNQHDNFICVLSLNHHLSKEETNTFLKFEFAVCYKPTDTENHYWDNNNGLNYVFQCFYPKL